MLESITQQLAGEARVSKSDAYMQLLNCLTAYGNTPGTTLLCEKVGSIVQYIRRDISQEDGIDTSKNVSDLSLVRQALHLLSMFMWNPEISEHIPDEFKVFFLDHAIASLQDVSLPKTLVVDYLRILSLQNFTPKILVNSKVHQLLLALKNITERVGGKAVVALRLAIYEKLLHQARSVFVSQTGTWLDNLVTALLHKVKDIRVKAIRLGLKAAETIGPNATVSKAVQDVMDVPGEDDGSTFVDELSTRLINMISGADGGAHVPQIWAVVVLLLRRNRWSIDQWGHLKKWLLVIQKCFNHSDSATKLQALLAWDRFVYTVRPSETTSSEMTKLLSRPILSQLERKRNDKPNALLTQAVSSYYHLLYYAFRPSTSHDRIDYFWKEYIFRPFSRALVTTSAGHATACRILAAMLWNPHPKPWDDKKPLEPSKLTPTDLPRLDFRWTRSRLSTILPVFELLFKSAPWSEGNISECPVGIAWTHLSKSLVEASSKEVQPSSESMQAIGNILEMLHRVWKDASGSLNGGQNQDKDLFLARFRFLSTTIISNVGALPFTDKLLLKTSDGTFQTASTPSHRHGPSNGDVRAPCIHLLQLIVQPQSIQPGPDYCHLVRGIIEACLNGRNSYRRQSWGACLDVLCQFANELDEGVVHPADATYDYALWTRKAIFEVTTACIDTRSQPSTPLKDNITLSPRDYEKVNHILSIGTIFHDLAPEWTKLFSSLVTTIQTDGAEKAIPPLIEDLVSNLRSHDPTKFIPYVTVLLDHAVFPHEKREKDNPSLPINKLPNSEQRDDTRVPFEKLMALTNDVLRDAYMQLPRVHANDLAPLFEATVRFADQCPSILRPTLLEKLQPGFAFWIADSEDKLTRKDGEDERLLTAVGPAIISTGLLSLCH